MEKKILEIGGVPISFQSPFASPGSGEDYLPFVTSDAPASWVWRVHEGEIPPDLKKEFPGEFRFFTKDYGGKKLIGVKEAHPKGKIIQAGLFDGEIRMIDIWREKEGNQTVPDQFYLINLIFWTHLLLSHGGLIVHALAVGIEQRGYLFPGPAGAGKSTLAGLLAAGSGAEIMAEDKVILRRFERGYKIYSSPWNPRQQYRTARLKWLRGIFFLKHSSRNRIDLISQPTAFRNMLRYSLTPFQRRDDFQAVVALAENLVKTVPCYRFGFRPDQTAVEFLLHNFPGKSRDPDHRIILNDKDRDKKKTK